MEVCLRQSSPYPPFLHLQRLHPHLYLRTGCHHHHYIRVEQLSKLNEKNNFQVGSDRQMVFIFPISFNFFIISIFVLKFQLNIYFTFHFLFFLPFYLFFFSLAMQCNAIQAFSIPELEKDSCRRWRWRGDRGGVTVEQWVARHEKC